MSESFAGFLTSPVAIKLIYWVCEAFEDLEELGRGRSAAHEDLSMSDTLEEVSDRILSNACYKKYACHSNTYDMFRFDSGLTV